MKVKLFMDVYAGMDMEWINATTKPGDKSSFARRIGFVVEIPDALVYQEDMTLPDTQAVEEK